MNNKKFRKPSQLLVSTIADNVRQLRHSKGLSQDQLADICGFHRTYIGAIERGERNISLSTLEALAEALDISIQNLITKK